MSFAIEQPKRNVMNPGHPLLFIDNLHFLIDSLDNSVKIQSKF